MFEQDSILLITQGRVTKLEHGHLFLPLGSALYRTFMCFKPHPFKIDTTPPFFLPAHVWPNSCFYCIMYYLWSLLLSYRSRGSRHWPWPQWLQSCPVATRGRWRPVCHSWCSGWLHTGRSSAGAAGPEREGAIVIYLLLRRSSDKWQETKTHLTLRVSEATVELKDFWPLLGQHQASVQHTWKTNNMEKS